MGIDAKVPVDFMGIESNDRRNDELQAQTIEIFEDFQKILVELNKYIETNSHAIQKLKWLLKSQKRIPSISEKDDHSSMDFSTTPNIMEFLVTHCSFFNYELLDNAVNVIDFKEGKEMLQSHKEHFKAYIQNLVIECPTCLGKSDGDQCCCYVFLDDTFKDYKQVYLKKLHHDISKILNRNIEDIRVHGVYPGSVIVLFRFSTSLVNKIFPLSKENIQMLKEIKYEDARILKIICGLHSYTLHSPIEGLSRNLWT